MKNICILGVTGSIGTQTLEVLRREKNSFSLKAVSANTNHETMIQIINEFNPAFVTMTNKESYNRVKNYCEGNNKNTRVLKGMDGLIYIATLPEVDIVVTSIVGMIGLKPTLAAIKAKKDIALANKETLVVGGELVMKAAKEYGVKILPVDSEHGAIFQCLQGNDVTKLDKIILTASGGPFRGKNLDELGNVSREVALKHPKWNMGPKISIDSATLMNKGLEVIEAHWLFNASYKDIEVVVHPQSVVHSMVQYIDGSVIAQLGCTDMKLPIQYALNYPERKTAVVEKLNFYEINTLTFERPDLDTFKCLRLAYEAGEIGGLMPTIMNAANEISVDLFLNKKIKFLQIGNIVEESMIKFDNRNKIDLESILEMDFKVREEIKRIYL